MVRHGIDLSSPAISDFCRRWKIRRLSAFGSVLRDDFGPNSDVDLLADFLPEADWDLFDDFHMQDELQAILGRRVDLVDREALDRGPNPVIRKAVLEGAEPVHEER